MCLSHIFYHIRVTVSVSSRIIIRRTLHDLYSPYFSPGVVAKFTTRETGHFVMLIETRMHIITWISGHIDSIHISVVPHPSVS